MKQIVFLLDETGSMLSNRTEVIQAFNRYTDGLRSQEGKFWLTLFNAGKTEARCEGVAFADIPILDEAGYDPDDLTPLYDAIMRTMRVVEGEALMVILTDGLENASQEFHLAAVKAGIEAKKALGWEFLFLASDLDVMVEGVRTVGAAASTPTVSHSHAMRTASLASGAYLSGQPLQTASHYAAQAAEDMGKEGKSGSTG